MTTEKQKVPPVGKIQIGNVKAAIWKRTSDAGRERYAATFERSYKTESGYKIGTDYNPQEILTLIEVGRLALEWIRNDEAKTASKTDEATDD